MKSFLSMTTPLSEGLALCREAGFLELDYLSNWNCNDYIEQAKRARDFFDRNGFVVHQTHCPFFRYQPNGIELFVSASKRIGNNADFRRIILCGP